MANDLRSDEGESVDDDRRETHEYKFSALSKFDRPQLDDDDAKAHLGSLLGLQVILEEEIRFSKLDVDLRDRQWAEKVAADEAAFKAKVAEVEAAKANLEESKRKLEALRAPPTPKR